MQRAKVEYDRIPGLEIPGGDVIGRRIGIDVGRRLHAARRIVIEVAAVLEDPRVEQLAPAVRAAGEAQRDVGAGVVERHVDRRGLAAVDAVVGQVLVPGGRALRAGRLAECVVVKELRVFATHELAGQRRRARMRDVVEIFGNQLPVAVAVEKAPGLAARIAFARERIGRWVVEVALQAAAQRLDPVGEHAAQQHDAVAAEGFDVGRRRGVLRPVGVGDDDATLPGYGFDVEAGRILHFGCRGSRGIVRSDD